MVVPKHSLPHFCFTSVHFFDPSTDKMICSCPNSRKQDSKCPSPSRGAQIWRESTTLMLSWTEGQIQSIHSSISRAQMDRLRGCQIPVTHTAQASRPPSAVPSAPHSLTTELITLLLPDLAELCHHAGQWLFPQDLFHILRA